MNTSRYEIAVDVGGTFTDGVLLDTGSDKVLVAKALTTPADPGEAVSTVVSDLLTQARTHFGPETPGGVRRVVHGTTLITNTLIERRGGRTALIVTKGTRDALDVARELRYDIYDLTIEYPVPLVPSEDRFEVEERLGPSGETWRRLTRAEIARIVKRIATAGYDAVAICLLHASANDGHERAIAKALVAKLPGTPISMSSEVAREIGEYERMSTVVANAYVQPMVGRYLAALVGRLSDLGLGATLDIMVSNGGFTTGQLASRTPIRLLESGPAGGVMSGINCAEVEGITRVLAFDMGGTTAKACVAVDGKPSITHSFEFGRVQRFKRGSGLPAIVPSIDLIEIGAGGGSLAALNALGLLQVGPQSAGAEPGPACYGQGGTEATVTDADLVLGYLDPDAFLGGRMKLDVAKARAALEAIGAKLGLNAEQAAWGVHDIVNEKMAAAARTHIAEKGLDARRFVMVTTGGAGPVHAVDVARRLRIGTILCPIASGVGSCLGFLAAPARADRSWSRVERVAELDFTDLRARAKAARAEIAGELRACGLTDRDIHWSGSAEMRYVGQGNSVKVDLGADWAGLDAAGIGRKFEAEYVRLFGRPVPGGIPEAITWRVIGESARTTRRYGLARSVTASAMLAPRQRRIYLPGEKTYRTVPSYDRYAVPLGTVLRGPLILAEPESTLIVSYPATVTVLDSATVRVELEGKS
ncbi:MAG: hydantoinase/oxoprolinase family protein [Alphaproteobacteria bacterium]|nr:hydantoinase/oxoprolinase family protein [Alphaproteobacteria bacterium]